MTEQTQSKVPEIRFSGFDGDWNDTTLGDSLPITSAARVHKDQWTKSGVRFFRSSDVVSNYKGKENEKAFISHELYRELTDKIGRIHRGDILVTGGGSIGIPYLVDSDEPLYFKDADLLWLKVRDALDSEFLYIYFSSRPFRKYVKSISHIGTIAHYTVEQAKSTPIKLPVEPDEQILIGQHFAKLDAMISQHQRKHAKLVALKKAMLQKMFPRDGATTPEIRFKGFSGDWEEKALGEIFQYERPDPYIVVSSEYSNQHKTPVLTANKAFILGYTNEVRAFDKPCLIFDDFTLESRYVDFSFMVKSSALKILTIRDSTVDDLYFASLLLRGADIEILGHARHYIGVVQPTIVMTSHLDEQRRICSYFHSLDTLIARHKTQITKLRNIKAACLEKMFV